MKSYFNYHVNLNIKIQATNKAYPQKESKPTNLYYLKKVIINHSTYKRQIIK